jgi:hypothetical protein
MSEEKEPIDVVQVMYNALTKLEKQYVWVVMIKTPREDKIVVAFQEKEPTMMELAERDDVRDMFEYEYMHDTLTRESEEYGWDSMSDNVYDFNAEELAMNDDYYNYLIKQKRRRA